MNSLKIQRYRKILENNFKNEVYEEYLEYIFKNGGLLEVNSNCKKHKKLEDYNKEKLELICYQFPMLKELINNFNKDVGKNKPIMQELFIDEAISVNFTKIEKNKPKSENINLIKIKESKENLMTTAKFDKKKQDKKSKNQLLLMVVIFIISFIALAKGSIITGGDIEKNNTSKIVDFILQ